jgi:hypoxanthine phosphoribosyltransferase
VLTETLQAQAPSLALGDPPRRFRKYIDRAEIQEAVRITAARLHERFRDERPVFIGVLTGCFVFLADLVREANLVCSIDFVKISSYGDGMEAGQIKLVKDIDSNIRDRHVIIVDDIVDTGASWDYLRNHFQIHQPKSLTMAASFRKPKAIQAGIPVEFIAIDLPDEFVIGYGLDYAGFGRELPDLYILNEAENKA